jgi:tetratricopeptide (TPR) repeat protein
MEKSITQNLKKAALFIAVAIASLIAFSKISFAAGDDPQTRNLLIQKLSTVYLNLAPADSSKVAITLRLADLHAEKARVDSMTELQNGCTTCQAGKEDRLKALKYYREVMPNVPESSVGSVMAQVGHLYELTGNETDAIKLYQQIIAMNKSPTATAEAQLSVGEILFKRRDYIKAREHYAAVVNGTTGNKGLAAYRLAWCDFNSGKLEASLAGMVRILKTPELLSRGVNSDVLQIDRQFHEEVSRDYATFMARRPVSLDDAKQLFELSPESAKLSNISYLAGETERLGQVKPAIQLWRFALEQQSKPESRLEGLIHIAQLEMEQKLFTDASKDYEIALNIWPQISGQCSTDQCKEMKVRLRNFVIDWYKVTQKNPTAELYGAYQNYLKVFPDDLDAVIWTAHVAQDLKLYQESIALYSRAAQMAALRVDKKDLAKVETSLLSAIEVAELAKDIPMKTLAYENYLKLSNDRKKALEVSYQQARIIYDSGKHQEAAEALKAVALSKEPAKDAGSADIKKQAADLSLDALVLAKNDSQIEVWAHQYAAVFPKNASEFLAIERKSVLTQAAAIASSTSVPVSDPISGLISGASTGSPLSANAAGASSNSDQAWAVMSRYNATGANDDEKLAFYKNKLILAEKLNKISEAKDAADQLLRQPGISESDRQFALSRKAWFAELALDFGGALASLEKIPAAKVDEARWLKLGLFAELSNRDPKPFYGKFLADSKDEVKKANIAALLVRDSSDPLKELERQKVSLAKQPQVLADLGVELYPKFGMKAVRSVLSNKAAAQSDTGQILGRIVMIDRLNALGAKLASQKVDSSSQKKLGTSLKARVATLEEVEKATSEAVDSTDWSAQLLGLDIIAKENDRFYQEIMSLPLPKGLTPPEEQQYLQALGQQAAPHQLKAIEVSKKVQEFWKDEAPIRKFEEGARVASGARRSVLMNEIEAISKIAPPERKASLEALVKSTLPVEARPKVEMIEAARQAVRLDPFSSAKLESLLKLEKESGKASMASYLEGRIEALKK